MEHDDEGYRPSALDLPREAFRKSSRPLHGMILSDFEFLDPENLAMCQRILTRYASIPA